MKTVSHAFLGALALLGCACTVAPDESGSELTASGGATTGGASAGGASPSGGAATDGGTSGGSGGSNAAGSGGVASGGGGNASSGGSGGTEPAPRDVTFYVVSDTHADPPQDSYDLRAISRAINAVSQGGQWPSKIGGADTGFAGGAIAAPRGVVFTGDITGWGTAPSEIATFRRYFEAGNSGDSISFPSYVGLGNHDLDSADRDAGTAAAYRSQYWAYVDQRHKGSNAPVQADSFDAASHAYSWDFDDVHFVQTHRFPGDTNYGLTSNLEFLENDLAARASDGRPVFVFHHYGMDAFGTEDRWWTASDREKYRNALGNYNVVSIFVGHSHAAFQYDWEGRHVIHVNNAKAENGTGNKDGNGSFAIARITDHRFDVVTCRWVDDQGHYELVAPFYSVPLD